MDSAIENITVIANFIKSINKSNITMKDSRMKIRITRHDGSESSSAMAFPSGIQSHEVLFYSLSFMCVFFDCGSKVSIMNISLDFLKLLLPPKRIRSSLVWKQKRDDWQIDECIERLLEHCVEHDSLPDATPGTDQSTNTNLS
jgi:hypothetical protein